MYSNSQGKELLGVFYIDENMQTAQQNTCPRFFETSEVYLFSSLLTR